MRPAMLLAATALVVLAMLPAARAADVEIGVIDGTVTEGDGYVVGWDRNGTYDLTVLFWASNRTLHMETSAGVESLWLDLDVLLANVSSKDAEDYLDDEARLLITLDEPTPTDHTLVGIPEVERATRNGLDLDEYTQNGSLVRFEGGPGVESIELVFEDPGEIPLTFILSVILVFGIGAAVAFLVMQRTVL